MHEPDAREDFSLSTYAKYAQEEEWEEFVCVPILVVRHLEQHELPVTEGVEEAQSDGGNHSAEEATVVMMRNRLRHAWSTKIYLLHMTFAGKKYETSSKLNRTPPMGAPKATATPAAQAALRMPRRLPV